jgi:hypothetical protein
MSQEPCRTSETDRLETFYVLGTAAIVVAWLVFLGGCSAPERNVQSSAHSAAIAAEQFSHDVHSEHSADELTAGAATGNSTLEEATPQKADDAPNWDETLALAIAFSRDRDRDSCNATALLQRQQRQLQKDIRRLRSDVRKYSSGPKHHRHSSRSRSRR